MKDFFRVMGKAFAVVFGSTSALVLVLVVFVLALRPLLRPYLQAEQKISPPVEQAPDKPPPGYYEVPPPSHQHSWDEHGKPIGDVVVLRNCDKLGCDVYRNFILAHEPKGFTPVPEFLPADELNMAIRSLPGTSCYDEKGERVPCGQKKLTR
ncbi:MAG TPA: hypothetical protein VHF01_08985 [Candidatus Acidoferrum sp.]|nr:hypothetical protein [Candidatus Acidoferrum sp.]